MRDSDGNRLDDLRVKARLDAVEAADARRLRAPGPAVIGQIGASITNNGTLSSYDKVLSGSVSYGSLSPMSWALPKTKGRFVAGGVAATNGFTTTQMIATHLPNVLLSNWDYCVVGEVTNDLGNGFTIADTKANVTTIIDALVADGKVPILTTVPPNNANATGAGLTWITQYNEWIKRQARILRVPIVDYHSVLVNPADNTFIPGYTSDGTHPVAIGSKVMGDALADVLNAIPGFARAPLAPAYNPNLLIPDACANSVGSDKIVGSGNATGLVYGVQTSTKWKGNAPCVVRGTVGDYSIRYPVVGSLVPGHRVRLAFNLIVPGITVGSGTWSAYLYNITKSQVIDGFSAVTDQINDGTSTYATDGAVAATNVVTCATSKPFRPAMVGSVIQVYSGLTGRFATGTTIIGVSPDGTQAYLSATTAATATAQTVIVLGNPHQAGFEFDVQSDMSSDTLGFYIVSAGAIGTCISASQVTMSDLTALGAA